VEIGIGLGGLNRNKEDHASVAEMVV
jgi:hypothetical protein